MELFCFAGAVGAFVPGARQTPHAAPNPPRSADIVLPEPRKPADRDGAAPRKAYAPGKASAFEAGMRGPRAGPGSTAPIDVAVLDEISTSTAETPVVVEALIPTGRFVDLPTMQQMFDELGFPGMGAPADPRAPWSFVALGVTDPGAVAGVSGERSGGGVGGGGAMGGFGGGFGGGGSAGGGETPGGAGGNGGPAVSPGDGGPADEGTPPRDVGFSPGLPPWDPSGDGPAPIEAPGGPVPQNVPEPATLSLLGAGALVATIARRRRR